MVIMSEDLKRYVASFLTFTVGFFGIWCNLIAARRLYRLPSYSPVFALYCMAHLIADSLVLLIFSIYVTPKVTYPTIWKDFNLDYETQIGYLAIAFQYCSFYTTMLITLNRAYVVMFPLKNTAFVRIRFAVYAIACAWAFAMASSIVLLIPDCSFIFQAGLLSWQWETTKCGDLFSLFIDVIYNCTFFIILILIDLTTVFVIHHNNKKFPPVRASISIQNVQVTRRRKQEIGFFVQSCIVSAGFVCMLCCYHLLSHLSECKFWNFLHNTLAWELSHCVQGVVIVVFSQKRSAHLITPISLLNTIKQTRTASWCRDRTTSLFT